MRPSSGDGIAPRGRLTCEPRAGEADPAAQGAEDTSTTAEAGPALNERRHLHPFPAALAAACPVLRLRPGADAWRHALPDAHRDRRATRLDPTRPKPCWCLRFVAYLPLTRAVVRNHTGPACAGPVCLGVRRGFGGCGGAQPLVPNTLEVASPARTLAFFPATPGGLTLPPICSCS